MDLQLAGKTAIVTGGSAGIGLACARTLVAEGVRVAIVGRSTERLAAATAAVPGLVPIAADLSDPGNSRKPPRRPRPRSTAASIFW